MRVIGKRDKKKDLFPCLILLFNNIHLFLLKFFDSHEKYTCKDNYPLPNINDNISLILSSDYWQLVLEKDNKLEAVLYIKSSQHFKAPFLFNKHFFILLWYAGISLITMPLICKSHIVHLGSSNCGRVFTKWENSINTCQNVKGWLSLQLKHCQTFLSFCHRFF